LSSGQGGRSRRNRQRSRAIGHISNSSHPNQDNPVGRRQPLHSVVSGATSANGVILPIPIFGTGIAGLAAVGRKKSSFIPINKNQEAGLNRSAS